VWDWLIPQSSKKGAGLPADTSFWTGLEYFKFDESETINITHKDNYEVRSASFEQLMSAFYQYKKQQAHE